jgi:TRAP-type C4-dicarboxylate transport system permease small subunit
LDAFIRAVRWLSRATGVASALLIGLAVLVICDMVIERYVFNLNTIWQIDFVTYAIVGATFIGSPYVLMHRGHVNVDILPMHSGPRMRYWLAIFTSALSLAFCAVLWWLCTKFWYEAWSLNWRSDTVWRSRLWIPYLAMPVGLGLLVLQYVVEIVCVATGRAKPFAMGGEPYEPVA